MTPYELWEKTMRDALPKGFAKMVTDIANQEIERQKLCLIDDIFKVLKCTSGFNGDKRYETNAGEVFDEMYGMSISDLEVELAVLSAKLKRHAWRLTEQE